MARNKDPFPNPENPVADAYTGATPSSNFLLKSKSDKKINNQFRVMFEINQFFDFNKYWINNKFPDNEDYKTSGQPALIYASELINPEQLPQTVLLKLIGHSHPYGEDGLLYVETLNTITTAKDIVSNISVNVNEK